MKTPGRGGPLPDPPPAEGRGKPDPICPGGPSFAPQGRRYGGRENSRRVVIFGRNRRLKSWMPKLNAVLMAVLAVAVIGATAFLTLRPAPAQAIEPAQVQKLLRKLADSDPDVRREGEAGLRQAGAASVAPLRDASKSSDRVLAERAAKLLQELQPASPVADAPKTE